MGNSAVKKSTTRILMLDSESTRVEGKAGHYLAGREYDLPDKIARAWILKRIAAPAPAEIPKPKKMKGG